MADSILNIVIRARDETQSAFALIQQQLKSIQSSLKDVDTGGVGKEATAGINSLGATANTVSKQVDDLSSQIKSLSVDFDSLGTIGKRVVGIFAGFFTVGYIKSLADTAARTEVLDTVLVQIAENAGITADYIHKVDESVQALGITAQSSRQSLSQFIQSGLDITKAADLARAAQDLAVIAGRDSSETFSRLITSIQQGNTVGLRWMGIVVDVEEAVQKYAAANDKVATAISKTERQQVLLNAVLEESAKKEGLYEASMNNVGKQLTSLARYQEAAAESAGKILLPAYAVLVQEFTLFLKQVTLSNEAMNATSTAGQTLADAIRPVASVLREVALFVKSNALAMLELLAVMYLVAKQAVIVELSLRFLAGGLSKVLLAVQFLALAWKGLIHVLTGSNAIGWILGLIGLLITGMVALYNIFKKDVPTDATDQIKDNFQILIDLEEKLERAKQEAFAASQGRSKLTLKEATDAVAALKEEIKAVKERNDELIKAAKLSTAEKKELAEAGKQRAKEAADLRETQDAMDDVGKAIIKMGLAGESAKKGLNISASFEDMIANLDKMVADYKKGMAGIGYESQVTQGQIDVMVQKIAEGAKTSEELRKAIERLGGEGSASQEKLKPLLKALELKEAKEGIADVQKSIADFIESASAASNTLKVLNSTEDTLRDSSSTLVQELLKIGVAAEQQGNGLDGLTGKLQTTAQSQKDLTAAEVRALQEATEAIEKRYDNEIAQIEATKQARLNAANDLVGNEAGRQAAILDAERKAATESIGLAKTKFDGLVAIQNKYLQASLSLANDIKKIDESIFESKRTLEEKLFNLSQRGKSEEQQQAAIREQILKRGAEAEAARLQGNFDLAKNLNDQRIALVDKLAVPENASEEQKVAIADELKKAYGQQSAILTDQKTIKEESLKTEIDGYNKTLAKIKEITGELSRFADEQVMKLSVTLDSGSLDTVVNQIKNALNDITISLKVKTEGFASGGLVTGPGTSKSDSILAALSNREYVMNADAVSRYGVHFMDMLNSMALPSIPRFAAGGLVGIPAANDSGISTGGMKDTVNLSLNIGGQKVSLMGERSQVRKLVGAFKNLEGG